MKGTVPKRMGHRKFSFLVAAIPVKRDAGLIEPVKQKRCVHTLELQIHRIFRMPLAAASSDTGDRFDRVLLHKCMTERVRGNSFVFSS